MIRHWVLQYLPLQFPTVCQQSKTSGIVSDAIAIANENSEMLPSIPLASSSIALCSNTRKYRSKPQSRKQCPLLYLKMFCETPYPWTVALCCFGSWVETEDYYGTILCDILLWKEMEGIRVSTEVTLLSIVLFCEWGGGCWGQGVCA